MQLHDLVTEIYGVGPELAKHLKKLGIVSVEDLLLYYPKKYEDFSEVLPIDKLHPGRVTIKAVVKQAKGRWIRGGLHITEAVASDDTASVRLVWFNQPYREQTIKKGEAYYISGSLELRRRQFAIQNPSMELVSNFPVNTARIVPVYRQHKDLKSNQIRKILRSVFKEIKSAPSTLPPEIADEYKLINKLEALRLIHFPTKIDDLSKAKRRLGFEEVFELMLASKLLKQETLASEALPVKFDVELAKKFVNKLPFKPTDAQRAAAWEILQDMEKPHPMNRLLEGDVGAGKTVVAALAASMVIKNGLQVALMAPTELLAQQHADTLVNMFKNTGMDKNVLLLTGSMSKAQKDRAHKQIEQGAPLLIVGTHALIQEKVRMEKLALAIVDEQHRFGVDQRKALLSRAQHMPHMLSMTATPIPRSLALTVYGELDISLIKTKPKNRLPIITKLITAGQRSKLYAEIDKLLAKGQQMFVVCPLISQSDLMPAVSVEAAAKEMEQAFAKRKVGILHGKQKSEDKQKIMQQFANHKLDILVSTTVIEVGVDVPNATIMLIESPERFGLAQIHQLRGRVGRGEMQGYCYLLLSEGAAPSKRLQAAVSSSDSFHLAELDLQLRGPGAIYGWRQHGDLDLRLVNLTDTELIKQASEAAEQAVKQPQKLLQSKRLTARIKQLQKINHLN